MDDEDAHDELSACRKLLCLAKLWLPHGYFRDTVAQVGEGRNAVDAYEALAERLGRA